MKEVADAGTYLASVDWFSDGKRLAIVSKEGIEIVSHDAGFVRPIDYGRLPLGP